MEELCSCRQTTEFLKGEHAVQREALTRLDAQVLLEERPHRRCVALGRGAGATRGRRLLR